MNKFPEIPNCKLYLCGGSVRDHLLNLPPHDEDYVVITDLSFDELIARIESIGGEVYQAKPEFMTIRCKLEGRVIDLVYPRTEEGYSDGRHPDKVSHTNSLKKDSERRDFTINAMYMDRDGKVIDFHCGRRDIYGEIIRCVGYPSYRFKEDYLRILRGLRFSIQFKFKLDEDVKGCMVANVKGLENISVDRIREELNKMLKIDPEATMDYIKEFEIMPILKKKGIWFKSTNEKR